MSKPCLHAPCDPSILLDEAEEKLKNVRCKRNRLFDLSSKTARIGKHLTVVKVRAPGRLPGVWAVRSDDDDGDFLVGEIRRHSEWNRYAFWPDDSTMFASTCLSEIASFLKRLDDDHRKV